MNPKELEKLVAKGENEKIEFKTEEASIGYIAKSVCGFLNSGGGKLLIGVDDEGRLEVDDHITRISAHYVESGDADVSRHSACSHGFVARGVHFQDEEIEPEGEHAHEGNNQHHPTRAYAPSVGGLGRSLERAPG